MPSTITNINQLDLINGIYTYADYLKWQFKERVELLRGKILEMSPAPARRHQVISTSLTGIMYNYFTKNPCSLYHAPFDVRFPDESGDIKTVVQPDICVICDEQKLDDRGCIGAPDLIVEILSPGNSNKEISKKFRLYEEEGVREYWMIRPDEKSVQIFILQNGKYIGLAPIADDEEVTSTIFPDFSFNTKEIFRY